jgi:hypothetical protein
LGHRSGNPVLAAEERIGATRIRCEFDRLKDGGVIVLGLDRIRIGSAGKGRIKSPATFVTTLGYGVRRIP